MNGEFELPLGGTIRTLKCTFRAIETLEKKTLNRGIVRALTDFSRGDVSYSDVVGIIHVGLAANKDTRMDFDAIGDDILASGTFDQAVKVCVEFLSYALTGGKEQGASDPMGKS